MTTTEKTTGGAGIQTSKIVTIQPQHIPDFLRRVQPEVHDQKGLDGLASGAPWIVKIFTDQKALVLPIMEDFLPMDVSGYIGKAKVEECRRSGRGPKWNSYIVDNYSRAVLTRMSLVNEDGKKVASRYNLVVGLGNEGHESVYKHYLGKLQRAEENTYRQNWTVPLGARAAITVSAVDGTFIGAHYDMLHGFVGDEKQFRLPLIRMGGNSATMQSAQNRSLTFDMLVADLLDPKGGFWSAWERDTRSSLPVHSEWMVTNSASIYASDINLLSSCYVVPLRR